MKPLTRRQRPSTTQAKTGSRTNYQVSISQVCAFTAGIAIHYLSHAFHKCVLSLSLSTVCFDPWATDRINVCPPPLKTKVHLLIFLTVALVGLYMPPNLVFSCLWVNKLPLYG